MERFVHDQNLMRYLNLLDGETDPAKRGQLGKLLLEEIERFGCHSEQLYETNRLVTHCTARLQEQKSRAAHLGEDGHDAGASEDVLANMSQTLALVVGHRQTILDRLDSNRFRDGPDHGLDPSE